MMSNEEQSREGISFKADKDILKDGERIDDLQCRGYRIIQNPSTFCFGMDAVLLADFASGKAKGNVIDLGTGTGVIPMLMEAQEKARILRGWKFRNTAPIWRQEAWV